MAGSVCLILHRESLMPAAYVFTAGAARLIQTVFGRFLDLKMM